MRNLEKIRVLSLSPKENRGRIVFVYSEDPARVRSPSQIINILRDTARRRRSNLAHAPTDFLAAKIVRRWGKKKKIKEEAALLLLHEHLFGIAGYDGGGHPGQILIKGTESGICVLEYVNLVRHEFLLLRETIGLVGWRIILLDPLETESEFREI